MSKSPGYRCVIEQCNEFDPKKGGYGPPLMHPDSGWFCGKHFDLAWAHESAAVVAALRTAAQPPSVQVVAFGDHVKRAP